MSSFVLNIKPLTFPTGDGLAFILTEQILIPENSGGQWLGIINSSTIGLINIVGVEFDTRKSYVEDIDNNHIGIDVRSAVSINSQSLSDYDLNLSSGSDIMATVKYDAKSTTVSIFVSSVDAGRVMIEKPIISQHLDLSGYLPEVVYVGFAASTGADACQLNTVKSWNFTSFETSQKESVNHMWIWILVLGILAPLLFTVILYKWYCWKRQRQIRELLVDEDPEIEPKINSSSTAPQKFRLKDLKFATDNFSLMNKLGKGGVGFVWTDQSPQWRFWYPLQRNLGRQGGSCEKNFKEFTPRKARFYSRSQFYWQYSSQELGKIDWMVL
ncbi:hypothetical protein PTKIN_Ptkin07bG0057400 [Pterospermum kingtungense]